MLDMIVPSPMSIASITILGLVFGLILSLAKLKLKVVRDERIEAILDALPGVNCGACGLPGCSAYATGIVVDKYDIGLCPVGGAGSTRKIAGIMGVDAGEGAGPVKARIHCHGGVAETAARFIYNGPRDCSAANDLMGGFKACQYGCLGFADCVRSCPFDAIVMNDNGLPQVDIDLCVGCGKCVTACPRDIISLTPEKNDVYVMCRNRQKTREMKQGCTVGCTGCKKCERVCMEVMQKRKKEGEPEDVVAAITVDSFCADIDYDICIRCYRCAVECPVPVINPVSKSRKLRQADEKEEERMETVL
jgi:Na+-translocating ferredoxin:NAD+ oxidoreductase RNF subunit RnfB